MKKGDQVEVVEAGITPWAGVVLAVKPDRKARANRIEVQREDGLVWSVIESCVRVVA